MICAWDSLIHILPIWMRDEVDRLGRENLQELRLRKNLSPELIFNGYSMYIDRTIRQDDLDFCINIASNYSPWTATTLSNGYITAAGGHRIGVCGEAVVENGFMTGIRSADMLCIRVARDFPGISKNIPLCAGSTLIIGSPGSGKTTLLRDLIRRQSQRRQGSIGVVDERRELFPKHNDNSCFDPGPKTDILSGCRKGQGIEILIRCMNPITIAVDEITSKEDCKVLLHAAWCGVSLFATAHAGSKEDLYSRMVYKPLIESQIFKTLVIMHPDKSIELEMINQ